MPSLGLLYPVWLHYQLDLGLLHRPTAALVLFRRLHLLDTPRQHPVKYRLDTAVGIRGFPVLRLLLLALLQQHIRDLVVVLLARLALQQLHDVHLRPMDPLRTRGGLDRLRAVAAHLLPRGAPCQHLVKDRFDRALRVSFGPVLGLLLFGLGCEHVRNFGVVRLALLALHRRRRTRALRVRAPCRHSPRQYAVEDRLHSSVGVRFGPVLGALLGCPFGELVGDGVVVLRTLLAF
mmetsp:Transcript_15821/g.36895  ORF Transcript_15821/g.36895 Transcript_15821/m.36895 type:complete len:234 (+) Transcript_15821:1142-1843(+)